mmetsp:Transcript_11142/g.16365  ORF Transcript_11142/g.16365 Transcript_11142/m.16365 type:complete len:454 (-) Transcript_11142:228-1589(-)
MMRTTIFSVLSTLLHINTAKSLDNGIGLLPPMGWRSWNCYGENVNQSLMESIMDRITERVRLVDGTPTSLADLGYIHVGLDDNWQKCGAGIHGSFHDKDGNPIINKDTFPNMKAMTDYAHSLGLLAGWYMNNCICAEHEYILETEIELHMIQSAKAVAEAGFDGVKLDGCGQFRNLTWWAELLNATGRHIMIENCHWGGTVPGDYNGDAPCNGLETMPSDCPYNFFRTSGDIRNNWHSMFFNLQTTIDYQGDPPLSRPGAWAYPDMLEVGRLASFVEDRTHFGAWVITSSPLILGNDLHNDVVMDKIWPIVANPEAISINQVWYGHPGRLAKQWTPPNPPSLSSGSNDIMQLWVKPISKGTWAALIINAHSLMPCDASLSYADIGLPDGQIFAVRDVWARRDAGTWKGGFLSTDVILPHDSRLYVFTQCENSGDIIKAGSLINGDDRTYLSVK